MSNLRDGIGEAISSDDPVSALSLLLDRVEATKSHTKREAYDALMSFLPTDDEGLYDIIADELDLFVGWCNPTHRRWPDEPDIH